MILLLIFSFIAGVITILSPCILPVLPIILSSISFDKKQDIRKPYGVILGFILSFTIFTLFLSSIVSVLGISATNLRLFSVFILGFFGLTLVSPKLQKLSENFLSKLIISGPKSGQKTGLLGGLLVGLSLGLLWTPCVGPILASVISLAVSGSVTFSTFLITLTYAAGTALPMLAILIGGKQLLQKVPWITNNTAKIQKSFGVLMVATALAIFFNIDRKIQTIILNLFPNYGMGLTKIEDNLFVKDQIKILTGETSDINNNIGKPSSELNPLVGPKAEEIIAGGKWFNSEPLKLSDLKGKVVLIDFWTYSCINCQRTLPYLKDWWNKYKDKGLVIIGIHSPEFEFEKDPKNVAKAISDFGILYPVVQDNNFDTWRAYNNRYWPAKYFIDKNGHIRSTHFGEGAYDESEKMIQDLLNEQSEVEVSDKIDNPTYEFHGQTPETYLGYLRLRNISSNEKILKDTIQTFTKPNVIPQNTFALEGEWNVGAEYSNPKQGSNLYLNFGAKEVYLVMSSKAKSSKVTIFVDDNNNGTVTIDSDRLYKLINLEKPGRHILRIRFEDNDAKVFAFTFG